ncbi:MAG: hypothetical protein J5659_04100 [Clostridia bacterium]|nr:hypothetical protein [Clostridia bacterium]
MEVKYYLADPAGNITALVIYCSNMDIKLVTKKIMQENKSVEQVGFVHFSDSNIKLRMSGDEFCGNATMSAAALCYLLSGKRGVYETSVSVFGTKKPIDVSVEAKDGCFKCKCEIKKPYEEKTIKFCANGYEYQYPLVVFEGIMHIVADEMLNEPIAESVIRNLAYKLDTKALGIMLLSKDKTHLNPLVYVKDTDTLFFEKSCASGSCAVGTLICKPGEEINLYQPGGVINVLNGDDLKLSVDIRIGNCHFMEV